MAKSKWVAAGTAAVVMVFAGAALYEECLRNDGKTTSDGYPKFGRNAINAFPMEIANQVVGTPEKTLAATSTAMLQSLYWAGAASLVLVTSAVTGLAHRFCCSTRPTGSPVADLEANLNETSRLTVGTPARQ